MEQLADLNRRYFLQGAVVTFAPFLISLAGAGPGSSPPTLWRLIAAVAGALCGIFGPGLLFKRSVLGKLLCLLFLCGLVFSAWPLVLTSPFMALGIGTLFLCGGFSVWEFRVRRAPRLSHLEPGRLRAQGAMGMLIATVVISLFEPARGGVYEQIGFLFGTLSSLWFFLEWARAQDEPRRKWILTLVAGGLGTLAIGAFCLESARLGAFLVTLPLLWFLGRATGSRTENWWLTVFLNHPARSLFSTFLGLAIFGTLLLRTPVATERGIAVIDAAFTAVSAVCVTGLVVMDTGRDFTPAGQFFLLLMMQLGGLGIMTIATMAMHALGRVSLSQERTMNEMTDTSDRGLFDSLMLILRVTFLSELAGALVLAPWFYHRGLSYVEALWQGIFTSVAAFCNAGFSLTTGNLVPYQHDLPVLGVVGILIILGGLAPAACLMIPRFVAGRSVPLAVYLAFWTTLGLIVGGTVAMLAFEWNGVLAGLNVGDKVLNAWFQAVTLRTAGFNSVELSGISGPTCLMMIFSMFVGGSPGGTAGGIKTTTLAVLGLTFWANVTGRDEIVVRNRRIRHATVYRAVTITMAALAVLALVVMMLLVTQPISARDLIFEATSALATVGLSTGATTQLDGIGKFIIMLAMFIGRIGPMTIFMLLSSGGSSGGESRCPEARIMLS